MPAEPFFQIPGGLDKFFQSLVNKPELKPKVLSSPPEGPWVVTLDSFFEEKEIDKLLKWGEELGYHESMMTSYGRSSSLTYGVRNSKTVFCNGGCQIDEDVERVEQKVADLTGSTRWHMEFIQFLKYDPGTYFKTHHDAVQINKTQHLGGGPRVLTFFLYLSDAEEGGQTRFNELGIDVIPKRGRVLIWPNVLDKMDEDGNWIRDERLYHEAVPVTKGQKFAANLWIHSHEFRRASLWSCPL